MNNACLKLNCNLFKKKKRLSWLIYHYYFVIFLHVYYFVFKLKENIIIYLIAQGCCQV